MLTSIAHVYPGRTSDNTTYSYGHDRLGRVVEETVSNTAYAYDPVAQTQTVAYGAATAINTYPSVGGQAITYIDGYSQSRGLHSAGNLHSDGQGWCGLRAPVHHPPILRPFDSVFSPF